MNTFEKFIGLLATEGGNIFVLLMLVAGGTIAIHFGVSPTILITPALSILFRTMSGGSSQQSREQAPPVVPPVAPPLLPMPVPMMNVPSITNGQTSVGDNSAPVGPRPIVPMVKQ